MDVTEEIIKLKKELALLRMKRVTKQKVERHSIKKIQNKISQISRLVKIKNH
uniref:Ribosomal protein L29 n=1 Tax=Polysiphonia sertularioides TaxID=945028 RepID=A0A1Z1MGY4_9FLOR|nr:ribosomal protein L29 [Polysiphonia sertularioides]